MSRFVLRIFGLVVLGLWARSALYTVDVTEIAYVTRFGQPVATIDGGTDAGLNWKLPWPIDSVQRVDRRLFVFDVPAIETLTRDPMTKTIDKTVTVDAFVSWRVPSAAAADRFLRTVGTPDQARRILTPQVSGRLAAFISTLPLDELVAVADSERIDQRTGRLRAALLADGLIEKVREEYGVEIVDLRLRRFGFPEAVRQSIAERIRSERSRKVADYESEGRKRASEIISSAEKEARTIEAEARAKKQTVEGQADVEADRIRNEAHAQDPEFYKFLQKLKAYQTLLNDTRDVLLISTKHPLFDLLLSPDRKPESK
jgi:modulator of FtsH protease HflC